MKILKRLIFLIIIFVPIFYSYSQGAFEGVVDEIIEETVSESAIFQKLKVNLSGGEDVEVENDSQSTGKSTEFKKGDKVLLQKLQVGDSEKYIITDYYRADFLVFLFIVFVFLSILIGKKHGFYSLIGMVFSFLVIFKFILPQIVVGRNPVFITVIASLFIIPVTFYLSHGFNKKTHIAIVSTFIALVFTSLLTAVSVNLANLTGYSSDEAMFLQISDTTINMKGILLAGIIIGLLGVLDDVTVSQASIVEQLKKSNRDYSTLEIYKIAMKVGRDHIASMTNTLVLVYAGASLPLLLMFINNPQPFGQVISIELIADEIVRTLIGSIGLILAVPLTTLLASMVGDGE